MAGPIEFASDGPADTKGETEWQGKEGLLNIGRNGGVLEGDAVVGPAGERVILDGGQKLGMVLRGAAASIARMGDDEPVVIDPVTKVAGVDALTQDPKGLKLSPPATGAPTESEL